MRFTTAAALAALASAAAAAPSSLIGLYRAVGDPQSCSLVAFDPTTAANTTLLASTAACKDTSTTWPAFLASAPGVVLSAIATAPAVTAFMGAGSPGSVHETTWAPLPPYNNSDPFLGLNYVSSLDATFLVSAKHVWSVQKGQPVAPLASVSLPPLAQVTAIAGASPADAALLVFDESSPTVYRIAVGQAGMPVTSFQTQLKGGAWDAAYSDALGLAFVIVDYALYSVDVTTGATTKLSNFPDGPGYPRVYGMSPDGLHMYVMDFSYLYVVRLPVAGLPVAINKIGGVTSAPRVVGYPVWVQGA